MSKRVFFYMLITGLLYTLSSTIIKLLQKGHLSVVQISFWSGLIFLCTTTLMLRYQKKSIWGKDHKWLLARGVIGAIALFLTFSAVKHLPLSVAITLKQTTGILTPFIGIFMLKEKVLPIQWLFLAISFSGIICIYHFDTHLPLFGLVIGILAALSAALVFNIIKKIGKKEDPLVITFYLPLITVFATGTYLSYTGEIATTLPQGYEWVMLSIWGLVSIFSRKCHIQALKLGSLIETSLMLYLTVVYGTLIDIFFFNNKDLLSTLPGIIMILLGVLLNTLYKYKIANNIKKPAK